MPVMSKSKSVYVNAPVEATLAYLDELAQDPEAPKISFGDAVSGALTWFLEQDADVQLHWISRSRSFDLRQYQVALNQRHQPRADAVDEDALRKKLMDRLFEVAETVDPDLAKTVRERMTREHPSDESNRKTG